MTTLDVGSVVGRVRLDDTQFQRAYAKVVGQMQGLGRAGTEAAAGTAELDASLSGVGTTAAKATAEVTKAATSEERAARAAQQHAAALAKVDEVMSVATTDAQRMQQAQLRLVAAQERYDQVVASGTASTRQLATAQAGLIGAQRNLQRTQEQIAGQTSTLTGSMDRQAASLARVEAAMAGMAGATEREQAATLRAVAAQERYDEVLASGTASTRQLAAAQAGLISAQRGVTAAQEAGAASSRRFGGALGGTLKMAGELGLMFGAFEAVKKVIDITKQANEFQRSMVQVQTNADVTAAEVTKASGALLDMAGPVAAAPSDLATAWYHAKSVGLDYAKSIDVTRIAAEGARVGHADLEQTMNALTSTVASGIPGVKDMSSAMGQLIAIVGSGDMKLTDLNDALGTGVLVRMKQYGLSLTDVGAALATFGDNNIRGADAATLLRMSVEAMAKQGKPGEAALARIGIQANQLRDDMQKGGLNKAVLDLNAHLKAAGVTGDQVGGFLIDAFTKKGGGGVAVLLGQVDRLESKFAVLRDSGASFGDKWKATTETASFALASLGHGAEAAGIKLTEKLGPDIAAVAHWFSQELPVAAHVAESVIGGPLAAAWTVLSTGIKLTGDVLGPVLHLLDDLHGPLTVLGTSALAAYAGFRLFSAIPGLLSGMWGAIQRVPAATAEMAASVKASVSNYVSSMATIGTASEAAAATAGTSMAAIGDEAAAMAGVVEEEGAAASLGWSGLLGPIGLVVAGATAGAAALGLFGGSAKSNAAEVDALTAAIQRDNGALGANSAAVVSHALASSGALDNAKALGIHLNDVTDAALHGGPALAALNQSLEMFMVGTWGATKDTSAQARAARELYNALNDQNSTTGVAIRHAREEAEATGKSTSATNSNATAQARAALAAANNAASVRKLISAELALINVSLAQAQSQDQFLESINATTQQLKSNNGTLSQNTANGLANRDALLASVQAALSLKDAQDKAGGSVQAHTRNLANNIANLRAAAIAAGADKGQVDALLRSLHATPREIRSSIKVDNAQANQNIRNTLDLLGSVHDKTVTVTAVMRGNLSSTYNSQVPQYRASGGPVFGRGSETSDSIPARLSNNEHVMSAAEVRGLGGHGAVAAIRAAGRAGRRLMAFATGGGITTSTTGGKKVWVFGGQQYASLRAAENAQSRAETAAGKKEQKLKVEITSKDFPALWAALTKTTAELVQSEKALTAAARQAGLGQQGLARIAHEYQRLNSLSRTRNRIANQLGAPSTQPQTAWQALEAARQNYQGEHDNVASTISGGFDLAQAGRSSGTGVTIDSILGDSAQQEANAQLFNTQLVKLKAMGLGKEELQQLAEKGFAGAESSTLALLGASRKQIRQLNSNVSGLNTAAGQTGTFAADVLYGQSVKTAQNRVNTLTAQEHRIDHQMQQITEKIAAAVARGLHIEVHIGGEKIDERVTHRVRHEHRQIARQTHLQAGRPR